MASISAHENIVFGVTEIQREFTEGWFKGKVMSMTDSAAAEGAEQLYAVVYEDGDEEDLTLAKLLPLNIHRRAEEEAAEMCLLNDGTVDESVQASEEL